MHPARKRIVMEGRKGGSYGKAPVVTLVEREGRVRTHHMEHVTSMNIKRIFRENISKEKAYLLSDDSVFYKLAEQIFTGHEAVNHSAGEYVRGGIHVNTAESVHALLKRGVMGVYRHWSKKHLHRYLAEFDFRWNARYISDGERTAEAIKFVGGKRLKYRDSSGN